MDQSYTSNDNYEYSETIYSYSSISNRDGDEYDKSFVIGSILLNDTSYESHEEYEEEEPYEFYS